MAAGQLNDDSYVDLIAGERTGTNTGQVEFWKNDGSGNFSRADYVSADGPVTAVALGTIDPDYSLDVLAGNENRSVQSWFCNSSVSDDILPAAESWADANTGGVVNAIAVGKVETSGDTPDEDPLYDVIVGTAITSTTGEIVIYLNPYVFTLTP
jgi:hypothetical protein